MGKSIEGPSGIKAVIYRNFNAVWSKKRQAESKDTFLRRLKELSYDEDPVVRAAVALNLVSRLNLLEGKNEKVRLIKDIFACRFNMLVLADVAKHKATPPWAIAGIIFHIIPRKVN